MKLHHAVWFLATLLALAALTLAGCGGGGAPGMNLVEPTENPALPGSIGGTLFTMDGGTLGQAQNAEVTLRSAAVDPVSGPVIATTHSILRGGYHFDNVAAGDYQISATITSGAVTLSGRITGVHVRGNIPTLGADLMLGRPTNMATFTGQVYTLSGASHVGVAGAIVNVEVDGNTASGTLAAFIGTTTDADGHYTLSLPAGALRYIVAAHSGTSEVSATADITGVTAGQTVTNDLQLTTAGTPQFDTLEKGDYFATTLPEPGQVALQQALLARIAVARSTRSSSTLLEHLLQRAQTVQSTATRANGGFVENDITWYLTNNTDYAVHGFNIYRSSTQTGNFIHVDTTTDPYAEYFYDNDPALVPGDQTFYTVTSYSTNGSQSAPMQPPFYLRSMYIFTVNGPADGATLTSTGTSITWQAQSMGLSYVMIFYTSEPVDASVQAYKVESLASTATSYSLDSLPNGTYWWTAAVYNYPSPNGASAAAFTPIKQLYIAR